MSAHRKILIVDDSRVMRELLRVVLQHTGFELIFAEDGVSAVEMAQTEKPDIVITDGLLPKMHGFVVCKTIKELVSPPKVILLTGVYTKPTYKWEVMNQYHADDVLTKPVKPADLLACLEKQIASLTAAQSAEPTSCQPVQHAISQNSLGSPAEVVH